MYKKILVPLDGSKNAEAVLPHVEVLLGQNNEAKAILLMVIESQHNHSMPGMQMTNDRYYYEKATKSAEGYLRAIQKRLSIKEIKSETYIANGPPVKGIVHSAEHRDVDLIAMASHGRTGLARVFYGSVAAGVLHQVDRPLLLIRTDSNK